MSLVSKGHEIQIKYINNFDATLTISDILNHHKSNVCKGINILRFERKPNYILKYLYAFRGIYTKVTT